MKKILYIVSTLQRTGPTNVLFNLVSHLDRTKFQPVILTLSPENNSHYTLQAEFLKLDVEIHSIGLSRIAGFLLGNSKILEFAQRAENQAQNGQIRKEKDTPLFDIISMRYQTSGRRLLQVDVEN